MPDWEGLVHAQFDSVGINGRAHSVTDAAQLNTTVLILQLEVTWRKDVNILVCSNTR